MTHETHKEPLCLLIKNSKYGHDYELYTAKEAEKVDLEQKEKEWHEHLLDECDIEPNEDDYVEWYGGDIDPSYFYVTRIDD